MGQMEFSEWPGEQEFNPSPVEESLSGLPIFEQVDCQYCQDVGPCMYCKRGQEVAIKIKKGPKKTKGKNRAHKKLAA